ncbi:MAG: DUF87 domain-containing protein [Coriobacteriia bacterium]|nr:DUF87 domain-containing protein [Coriobacteriia bacterium]
MAKTKTPEVAVTRKSRAIESIAPSGVEFFRTRLQWGEYVATVLAVTGYPPKVMAGWLSRLASLDGVVVNLHAAPYNPAELIDNLNKSIVQWSVSAETDRKDALSAMRARRALDEAQTLLVRLDAEKEVVFRATLTILVYAIDDSGLDYRTNQVIGALAGQQLTARTLAFLQEGGVLHTGPYGYTDPAVEDFAAKVLPASTLAGGLPFVSSGINDAEGLALGRDGMGGVVILDIWKRGADRTNANWTVLGAPGMGKSTAVKKILLNEWATGTKIIVIDPEREYRDMCRAIGGQWVNAGGGATVINPLQISDALSGDEDDIGQSSALARQIQMFKTFAALALRDLSSLAMAELEAALETAYRARGITWDTDPAHLGPEDYPTMHDLYEIVGAAAASEHEPGRRATLTELRALLRSAAEGAGAVLWNGTTNVELSSDFIVLDTHELQEADDATRRAQYFNLLTTAWERVQANRADHEAAGGRILLAVDEAYLLVDPNVPQALETMRNFSKRIRKYGGGFIVISHNAGDFLDPEVKRSGQALMNDSCFKMIFGADGKNLKEIRDLYDLSDGEADLLAAKQRARAWLKVGSRSTEVRVTVSDEELAVFGGGGGR